MKEFCRTAVFLALWSLIGIMPSFAQEGEDVFSRHWVDYRNGEISLAFDATPVSVALGVIRDRTGFRIDIPSPDQEQVINLRLSSLPLDPAMRYVITSIGYENFAVMYDDEGRPYRAVLLNASMEERANLMPDGTVEPQNVEPSPLPLTEEEIKRIKGELERWHELKDEQRGRIVDRLKSLPASAEREQLVRDYGKTLLGLSK